jgi:FkbM family methyltransferase
MRDLIAEIFKILFKVEFFKGTYYGFYKRVFKPLDLFHGVKKNIQINGSNFQLHIDDWVQQNVFFLGEYEPAELKAIKPYLKEDSVFIDVGANFGWYSLFSSFVIGNQGKVIAFEPFPENFRRLSQNISLNPNRKIIAENLAVGQQKGSLDLFYNNQEQNLGMVSKNATPNSRKKNVPMIAFDDYVSDNKIDKIDFIKIDIEGAELQALMGMKEVLRKLKPVLLVEILKEQNDRNSILSFLSGLGYQQFYITNDGAISEIETTVNRDNYLFAIPSTPI